MVKIGKIKAEDLRRALFREVEAALAKHQPELSARMDGDLIAIEGTLETTGPEGPFDHFSIEAFVTDGFPSEEPAVWETGGRIPREPDRHVFAKLGNCCLGVWEEWLLNAEDLSFEGYLVGPLHSYFVSQSEYERTGMWPFDQRSHDRHGIVEAYGDILGVDHDEEVVLRYLSLLRQERPKGHRPCPCGSGRRLRDCHREAIDRLHRKVPPLTARRMQKRLA